MITLIFPRNVGWHDACSRRNGVTLARPKRLVPVAIELHDRSQGQCDNRPLGVSNSYVSVREEIGYDDLAHYGKRDRCGGCPHRFVATWRTKHGACSNDVRDNIRTSSGVASAFPVCEWLDQENPVGRSRPPGYLE